MIHGANCNCKECESALSHKIESAFKDAELAKRFTELTGLELPENYNAADILSRMKEKCGEGGYEEFVITLIIKSIDNHMGTMPTISTISTISMFIDDYVLNAPVLLRKAVEYLEGK